MYLGRIVVWIRKRLRRKGNQMEKITQVENDIAATKTRLALLEKQRADLMNEEFRQGLFGSSTKQRAATIVKHFGSFVAPGQTVAVLLTNWKVYDSDVCDLAFKTFYNGRIGETVFPIAGCSEIGLSTYPEVTDTFFPVPEGDVGIDIHFHTARMIRLFRALQSAGYTAWVEYAQLHDTPENRAQLADPETAFVDGRPTFMILCLSK